jgi:hypothetical protein
MQDLNFRALGEALSRFLRDLLYHPIPANYPGAGRTGGHLYQYWLAHGGTMSPQAIRIDHHMWVMNQLGYRRLIDREIKDWNNTFAPITRDDHSHELDRIVLELQYHNERWSLDPTPVRSQRSPLSATRIDAGPLDDTIDRHING